MLLPINAQDRELSQEDAKTLDDEFYRSDPNGYFRARIAALLNASHASADTPTPDTHPEFFAALTLDPAEGVLDFDEQARKAQTAVDALALRQHVAESLVRFLHALIAAEPELSDAPSMWMAVTNGPNQLQAVREQLETALDVGDVTLPHLMFPVGTSRTPELFTAMQTASEWINHALHLLLDDELAVNVAHNKVKHGLAISARSNMRVELIARADIDEINGEATVPLSAFGPGRSIPLFDRPFLTYLTRRRNNPSRGVEAVSLRVDIPVVLAEAWMMANVYGCLFNIAAVKHFGEGSGEDIAPYPRLVLGATPERVIGGAALGTRANITLPMDPRATPRAEGVFFFNGFVPLSVDLTTQVSARVVADESAEGGAE